MTVACLSMAALQPLSACFKVGAYVFNACGHIVSTQMTLTKPRSLTKAPWEVVGLTSPNATANAGPDLWVERSRRKEMLGTWVVNAEPKTDSVSPAQTLFYFEMQMNLERDSARRCACSSSGATVCAPEASILRPSPQRLCTPLDLASGVMLWDTPAPQSPRAALCLLLSISHR